MASYVFPYIFFFFPWSSDFFYFSSVVLISNEFKWCGGMRAAQSTSEQCPPSWGLGHHIAGSLELRALGIFLMQKWWLQYAVYALLSSPRLLFDHGSCSLHVFCGLQLAAVHEVALFISAVAPVRLCSSTVLGSDRPWISFMCATPYWIFCFSWHAALPLCIISCVRCLPVTSIELCSFIHFEISWTIWQFRIFSTNLFKGPSRAGGLRTKFGKCS